MEATTEAIKVPRLEDAGLEDCALPPEAIKEAFFKAAQSLRSWAVDTDEEGECVHDPKGAESSDLLIGIGPAPDPPGSCGNEKGLPEVIGDKVGSDFTEEKDDGFDKILGPEGVPEQGGDCVDGLRGLSIDKEKKKKNDLVKGGESDDEEEGDRNKEKPILTEGFAV